MNDAVHKIFYSWQDDRPNAVCRGFIENALKTAISNVVAKFAVDEAERPGSVEIDKDTKGVAGSPPITETIFGKIDGAVAYLADFTFIGSRADGRAVSNPNVLIEYGWALKSRGHSRIVGVMNTAYGEANDENLPFNMRHLRRPIRYHLPEGAIDSVKAASRKALVADFEVAIKAILDTVVVPVTEVVAPQLPYVAAQPKDGKSRFRAKGESLGVVDQGFGVADNEIRLADGPAVWLRVMPVAAQSKTWRVTDLRNAGAGDGKTFPPIGPWRSLSYVRGADGFGLFRHQESLPTLTDSVAYLFQSGEVWGVNSALLANRELLPNMEWPLVPFFNRAVTFLQRDLGVKGPYRWLAGIEDTKNRQFAPVAPPGKMYFPSPWKCLKSEILGEGVYDIAQPMHLAMLSFYEEIYDACGLPRPPELNEQLKTF